MIFSSGGRTHTFVVCVALDEQSSILTEALSRVSTGMTRQQFTYASRAGREQSHKVERSSFLSSKSRQVASGCCGSCQIREQTDSKRVVRPRS
jgi:hypothetical protein